MLNTRESDRSRPTIETIASNTENQRGNNSSETKMKKSGGTGRNEVQTTDKHNNSSETA